MVVTITVPFFEVGVKNYIYGDDVLALALAADAAAIEFDLDVMFVTPFIEIRRVAEATTRLIVLAPHMDTLRPGRGIADALPEAIRAAGAQGVVLNHAERPLPLAELRSSIERAKEVGLLSFVCADTISDARAVAQLGPDIINPEQPDAIGTSAGVDIAFMRGAVHAIKSVNESILIEQAAGITTPSQVHEYISEGAEGVGVASGIVNAEDPHQMVRAMIAAVASARDERDAHFRGDAS